MTRRNLNAIECEMLEAGEEPAHILATGRLGRNEIEELHIYYFSYGFKSCTVVDGVQSAGRVSAHWAFDEVMEPSEVMEELEQFRLRR